MAGTTTIQISNNLKRDLDSFKEHNRETYEEVIDKLILFAKENEESKMELSNETLEGIKEAKEDIKKGRVYSTAQLKKELGF
jgi:predicted transcriptional regulator